MQQNTTPAPSATAAGFASLLSTLLASKDADPAEAAASTTAFSAAVDDDPWESDEDFEQATELSYENALRTHQRYSPTTDKDGRAARSSAPSRSTARNRRAAEEEVVDAATIRAAVQEAAAKANLPVPPPPPDRRTFVPFERNLKKASITIRLSQAEYAQLHHRASEAGLTISAYLRSCTLEAETLRAQVREALTQMKATADEVRQNSTAPVPEVAPTTERKPFWASLVQRFFGWARPLDHSLGRPARA